MRFTCRRDNVQRRKRENPPGESSKTLHRYVSCWNWDLLNLIQTAYQKYNCRRRRLTADDILVMKALVLCVVWFLIVPSGAYGDGCILPTAIAKVQIPDQRALIHFDNGLETLVIDTSFKGDGTNFAWIVPVL